MLNGTVFRTEESTPTDASVLDNNYQVQYAQEQI